MKGSTRGFTLIELLVVVAIIGILSSVVLASANYARNRGKYARVKTDIKLLINDTTMAQGNTGKTMIGITGNGCSDCNGCRSGDLRNISSSSGCYTSWVSALTNITTAAGQEFTNASQLTRDPWGSPYCLDENEREGGPRTVSLRLEE
jgi:prepilin-type N-terminal cleavage/methylation domain-containing protein